MAQSGCIHCGECDIGCNTHAKNTLDLNYLALAERHGATVTTQCEARYIAPGDDGGYVVHFHDHTSDSDGQVAAPEVFLCAGAVNSTELLLRSRDQHRTLPGVSDRLGGGYSANGDFLAFAFDASPDPYLPSRGPTITTGIVYDDQSATDRTWFVFEDGGYPAQVAALLEFVDPDPNWWASAGLVWDDVTGVARKRVRELRHCLAADSDHAAVFLVMGRDRANGSIEFLPAADRVRVRWDVPSNLPLYAAEAAFCNDIAGALGGEYVANPAWKYLSQPVSVHNLGGCLMGASAADGVVDADGEVFGYPGLHVLDGAILPAATGANPSHTIAAVTERCIERAIRRITGNAEWSAPERAHVGPIALPEDQITIPRGGTAPPRTAMVGMRFTETMRGMLAPADAAADGGLKASFRVTIASSDFDLFLADPTHPAAAAGRVWVDGYTGPEGEPIRGGQFNLFTEAEGLYRRFMLYSLPFNGPDGRRYRLQGRKEVWDHGYFDVWGSTTTLYATLVDADHPASPALASGVLRLNLPMFAQQMTTLRVTGTSSPYAKLRRLSSFGQFFTGTIFDVFVRSRLDP